MAHVHECENEYCLVEELDRAIIVGRDYVISFKKPGVGKYKLFNIERKGRLVTKEKIFGVKITCRNVEYIGVTTIKLLEQNFRGLEYSFKLVLEQEGKDVKEKLVNYAKFIKARKNWEGKNFTVDISSLLGNCINLLVTEHQNSNTTSSFNPTIGCETSLPLLTSIFSKVTFKSLI